MSPEEREALLAGYALGSLSAPDALDAERLIRTDEDAAAEYEAYREIADLVALSVPLRRADPSLRERVLRAARVGRVGWHRRAFRRSNLPVAAMAAALVLVVLWGANLQASIQNLQEQTATLTSVVEGEARRNQSAEMAGAAMAEARTLGIQLETALRDQNAVLAIQADPEQRRIEMEPTYASHGATGQYIWSDEAQAGLLIVHSMPPLGMGFNYKVWVETPTSRMVLANTFVPDESGKAEVVLHFDRYQEPPVRIYVAPGRTGSSSNEGPVVLHGTLMRDDSRR